MDPTVSRSAELTATKPVSLSNVPISAGENTQTVNNLGNPVFSCPKNINSISTAQTSTLTASEDVFQGYNAKTQHPMYMTSSMEYGSRQPTVHTMPTTFHAKNQKFSEHLGTCGMYRDHSLNTAMDKSVV
ncbi:UPF0691 protein C9orf116 homolog isoform X1 [Dendronephthya gigantea]|uniref:UPF0691 protein C9orf116 homolog isoform X1 n=1 Tax=Dendronephthya gigantea TaxID=151771 RepID=UPI00106DBDF6|nr:UPF0691 protein C9orf116 homolog isoform X1 [Dendronephthya gigantea]